VSDTDGAPFVEVNGTKYDTLLGAIEAVREAWSAAKAEAVAAQHEFARTKAARRQAESVETEEEGVTDGE